MKSLFEKDFTVEEFNTVTKMTKLVALGLDSLLSSSNGWECIKNKLIKRNSFEGREKTKMDAEMSSISFRKSLAYDNS
jgi:phosphoserine phosphatase